MNQGGGAGSGGAAPTGCYKCGRPGHWSRDCPLETDKNGNQDSRPDSNLDLNTGSRPPLAAQKPKQKAPRRTRPKLTPELLLSDAGIGNILRYFPRGLKCRGRGHEVDDLGHLLRLYADWHKRLLPYYNFQQFIEKVEQVGTTKRVKASLKGLREKVSDGVDLTKLQEPQVQQDSIDEQAATSGLDMPNNLPENTFQAGDDNNFEEDMPQTVWENATEEPSQPVHVEDVAVDADISTAQEVLNQTTETSSQNLMSEEQKARMKANRLKALERAAARSRSSRAS